MEYSQEQKLYAQVVQKAWEDAQFKNDLMTKPEETIEQLTGHKINLPQGQTLVINDQTDETITYFNIPRKVNPETIELTDEQLEMVAGGEVVGTAGLVLACVAIFGGGVAVGLQISSMKK